MDITSVPAALITELALGVEAPDAVAARHGFDLRSYLDLRKYRWFNELIVKKQAELEERGFTFQARMSALAEDLLVDAYQSAKKGESTALKLDVAKYLTKVADLEPKQSSPFGSTPGGGFSITINFNKSDHVTIGDAVTAEAVDALPGTPPMLDITPTNHDMSYEPDVTS